MILSLLLNIAAAATNTAATATFATVTTYHDDNDNPVMEELLTAKYNHNESVDNVR